MICVLVGLIPPDPKLADHVRSRVTAIDDFSVEWRSSYALAPDDDRDGAETLLLTAMTPAPAESVLEAVERVAKVFLSEEQRAFVCEMWASAPAPLPLRPLEGFEFQIIMERIEQPNSVSLIMKKWGLLIQKRILNSEGVSRFRAVVDSAIAEVHEALKKHQPQLKVGVDAFCFREIASRKKERFDLRLWSSEAMDLVQELVLGNANNQQILQEVMGLSCSSSLLEEIDFDLSVVYSRPGACAQGWHADGSHMPGAADAGWNEDGWRTRLANPYAICLFIPLIDLNDQVGYTQFWPASHQYRGLAGFGPVSVVTRSVWNGSCKAGDGIFYDYRLLHQGMPNTSLNVTRPVLQIIFKRK